uniref:Uncharacterized protein n=1 Tax=Anguilla anguilla TaxID=7936 RepID=A0A0E9SQ54_ANGAN
MSNDSECFQSCPSLHGHGLLQLGSSPAHALTQPGAPDPSPGSSKLHYSNYTIWSSTIPVNFHLGCYLFNPFYLPSATLHQAGQ